MRPNARASSKNEPGWLGGMESALDMATWREKCQWVDCGNGKDGVWTISGDLWPFAFDPV